MNRTSSRLIKRVLILALFSLFILFLTQVRTFRPSHSYPAPDFSLRDLNGSVVRLSDLRGKGVVLNFWATWCAPCRREMPWLVQLQKKYQSRGLQVLGVSLDSSGKTVVEPYVAKAGITYPILLDDGDVSSLYGATEFLPTTYYISRGGMVVAVVKGVVDEDEIEANIKEVLETPAEAGPK